MSKVVEENVVKNMAFLIKMLEKEWEVSKESIKTVFISMDEVAKVKSDLSFMIQVNTGVLNSNNGMTFKECMMMNKAITLDKEEAKLYKELFDKKN